MGRLSKREGSWRRFFRIAQTASQRGVESFRGGECQIRDPFCPYRASIGGFSGLMSDGHGAVLSRRTLATTVHGMHVLRSSASDTVRMTVYGGCLQFCRDEECISNVEVEERAVAMERVYSAVTGQREGGLLSSPSLGHTICVKCAKPLEAAHATWGSAVWEKLPPAFNISRGWDDLVILNSGTCL